MTKKSPVTTAAKRMAKTTNNPKPDASDPNEQGQLDGGATLNRRRFLGAVGGATAAAMVAGSGGAAALAAPAAAEPQEVSAQGALTKANRLKESYKYRLNMAQMAKDRPMVDAQSNGDDDRYASKIGSYSKGLPHNQLGEVDLTAYATLVKARESQNPADFEAIHLGLGRKLTSPQAGLAMDLEGPDSHHIALPPAPRFDSAEAAGEAAELYWMALARDVHFSDYATDPLISRAAQDLSRMSDFRGPKAGGQVTPATIFRGPTPGDLAGPWLSQFLTLDFAFGANSVSQKIRTLATGVNYMTNFSDWLVVQNGADPSGTIQFDSTPRYIRNLRDLAQWVHVDALYQAYLHACLIMMGQGTRLDPGLPLYDSKVQAGFAQCGGPHILTLVTEVATRALKAVWYQKWFVHHRLRPEEYGGRVHNRRTGAASYPLHADILNSTALDEVFSQYGTYLLPQAFPEGSPTHSSYGSGHATVAGACVTALKAFFDETDTVKNPMVASADGSALVPYEGPPLTVGGELNKVATNVATGRNGAGIHWRSDAINSLKLGEEVTICILQEQKASYNDNVTMTLTKFDGTKITI
ncbi:MAG TPA: vanadium-dependent haloperoxidase [Blastocatellia bacterium]|nr:vanadium-dependent haloperoxidase [Blastocatellia bacterium]